MYYDLMYILFDWKLGLWEIGAKIFVFQEIYETLLYLLAPFVIPISFATRPVFAAQIYIATISMYALNALLFNYVSPELSKPLHYGSMDLNEMYRSIYAVERKWSLSRLSSTTTASSGS